MELYSKRETWDRERERERERERQLRKRAGPHCTVFFGPLSPELGAGMSWWAVREAVLGT